MRAIDLGPLSTDELLALHRELLTVFDERGIIPTPTGVKVELSPVKLAAELRRQALDATSRERGALIAAAQKLERL